MTYPLKPLCFALAALSLAACGPEEGEVIKEPPKTTLPSGAEAGTGGGKAVPGTELCDASAYAHLIGTNVAATTFPNDRNIRVFGVNDIVTRDYIPQRTNIVYDKAGRIMQVYCG